MDNKELEALFRSAKEIDLVAYLARLGFHGKKIGNNLFYDSPLRKERTASFSVSPSKNVWKDWGTGEGGNIIDFGVRYFNCKPVDFVKILQRDYHLSTSLAHQPEKPKTKEEPVIKILTVKPLQFFPLLHYIKERKVLPQIAQAYCKEVTFALRDKTFYAIGLQNDSGGFALRNKYMKAASMPNDVTFINNGAKDLAFFEGQFDFLSYKTLYQRMEEPERNYLIANSTSFIEKCLSIMQEHRRTHSFLDNDNTGTDCTAIAQGLLKERFVDERALYKNYNDLNDFIKDFGLKPKQGLHHKP